MPIHKAIYKYGIDNFSLTILEECEISELDTREAYYIKTLKSQDKNIGYNICDGGEKGPIKIGVENANSVLTEEIVTKIRYLYLEGYIKK